MSEKMSEKCGQHINRGWGGNCGLKLGKMSKFIRNNRLVSIPMISLMCISQRVLTRAWTY